MKCRCDFTKKKRDENICTLENRNRNSYIYARLNIRQNEDKNRK